MRLIFFKISIFFICVGLTGCNNQVIQDQLPKQPNNGNILKKEKNPSSDAVYVTREKANELIEKEISNQYASSQIQIENDFQNYLTKDKINELIDKACISHKNTIEDALKNRDYLTKNEISELIIKELDQKIKILKDNTKEKLKKYLTQNKMDLILAKLKKEIQDEIEKAIDYSRGITNEHKTLKKEIEAQNKKIEENEEIIKKISFDLNMKTWSKVI